MTLVTTCFGYGSNRLHNPEDDPQEQKEGEKMKEWMIVFLSCRSVATI